MYILVESYLWNDGDSGAKIVEANWGHVDAVDCDVPADGFYDAEQGQRQGTLPGSRTAHYSNL